MPMTQEGMKPVSQCDVLHFQEQIHDFLKKEN